MKYIRYLLIILTLAMFLAHFNRFRSFSCIDKQVLGCHIGVSMFTYQFVNES